MLFIIVIKGPDDPYPKYILEIRGNNFLVQMCIRLGKFLLEQNTIQLYLGRLNSTTLKLSVIVYNI